MLPLQNVIIIQYVYTSLLLCNNFTKFYKAFSLHEQLHSRRDLLVGNGSMGITDAESLTTLLNHLQQTLAMLTNNVVVFTMRIFKIWDNFQNLDSLIIIYDQFLSNCNL